jgi:hypothetical protein
MATAADFSLAEIVANTDVQASSDVDNATATATVAAVDGVRHRHLGVITDYSAAVSAIKTITWKVGSTTKAILRWDFAKGPFVGPVPGVVRGGVNEAISVELAASGTGGITGRVYLFYSSVGSA